MTGTPIPASALSHDGKPGLQRSIVSTSANSASAAMQTDAQLDFTVKGGNALPPNSVITWKGTLTPPHAGTYWIYLQAMGTNARISLDGKRLASTGAFQGGVHGDILQANQDNAIPTTDRLDNVRRAVELTAGPHAIEVSTSPDSSNSPVQVRLNWYTPEQRKADHEHAIAAAKNAKVAVVFLWTRLQPVFGLPGDQDKLVEEIAAVNPNTIVVLNTSQPVALPWVDKVKAVLEMWWPGDEGGWSTANICSSARPAPQAVFPSPGARASTDYPATDPKYPGALQKRRRPQNHLQRRRQRWLPLVRQGKHRAALRLRPWPQLHHLRLLRPQRLQIQRRRPRREGEHQEHRHRGLRRSSAGLPRRSRRDSGRSAVSCSRARSLRSHPPQPGESKDVTLHVAPRQLQYWSTKDQKWTTASGKRTVSVGGSSRDLRLNQTID